MGCLCLGELPAAIHARLFDAYGDLGWWPANTPYEVVVGAVLTQNTAWTNVEKALANFSGDISPQRVMGMGIGDLADLIRPAGFFNQKARCLKSVTEWFASQGASAPGVAELPHMRTELLALKGVGPETADSILLYAFGLPSFVADAYTKRILGRLSEGRAPTAYDGIKRLFEESLAAPLFANMHALIVEHAKRHCRAKPACAGCALCDICLFAYKSG